jgi:hypothetical protein
MPGLFGYMLAVVVVLGGYFAGLHWLISPPDPWQPNPRITQSIAQQTIKKRPPAAKPAEAGTSSELTAPAAEPDVKLPNAETPEFIQTPEAEMVRTTGRDTVEPARPVAEPAHITRREVPPAKAKPGARKRVERSTSRKLELMVLRTYERSDGKRFTRLLPLNGARDALAFQPDDQW